MKIKKIRVSKQIEHRIKKKENSKVFIKKKNPEIEDSRKENRYNFKRKKPTKKTIKKPVKKTTKKTSSKTVLNRKNSTTDINKRNVNKRNVNKKKFKFKGINKILKIAIIIILFLIYIPTIVVWFMGKDIEIDYLRKGTLEEIINSDGIFVRNEEVLVAPITGKCVTNVFLGEKIGKNQEIGRITTKSIDETTDKLNYIDNKILKLIKSDNGNENIYSEDILKIDEDISDKLKEISIMSMENNIEGSEKIESEINELIKKKIDLISDSDIVGGKQLENLKKQKNELLDKVSENTIVLKAKNSGLIAYFIDGYENQYSPDNMDRITITDINNIKKITNDTFDFSTFNVESKKPYAKLIKDFESFIIISLDKNKSKIMEENDKINITIQDINKSTEASIVKKIDEKNKTKVYLKITNLLSETCTLRKAELEIIVKPYNGYKVPIKSLIEFDKKGKKAKIMLIKSNYTELKDVKIVVYDNEYAIIENVEDDYEKTIGLYDKFIINPTGVSEGERIKDD
ncbi:MAG: HlyD family efflux transporter periplasmic adaptor subunit [Clostridiales bacterium]